LNPLRKLCRGLGFDVVPFRKGELPPDFDAESQRIIREVRSFTMTSPERLLAFIESVRYAERAKLPGRTILMIGTQPLAPGRPANAALRDEQLRLLAKQFTESDRRRKPRARSDSVEASKWPCRFREARNVVKSSPEARRLRYACGRFTLPPS